jgi:hypothetical protein
MCRNVKYPEITVMVKCVLVKRRELPALIQDQSKGSDSYRMLGAHRRGIVFHLRRAPRLRHVRIADLRGDILANDDFLLTGVKHTYLDTLEM